MSYIDFNGQYYEGDKADHRHIEVPQRPSALHEWDGSEWAESPALIKEQNKRELQAADSGMIRGVDDLISVLIAKGAIKLTDLPEDLRNKYNNRKSLRNSLK